ncbi:hypothetical protein PWT90_10880 [Aphanocladium album]|nr:hypothetical protein PWT90_10880 [Aphanocladium album]
MHSLNTHWPHPPSLDLYVSAVAPYTVDDMEFHVEASEHWADGTLVLPYVEGPLESRNYYPRPDFLPFGHDIFHNRAAYERWSFLSSEPDHSVDAPQRAAYQLWTAIYTPFFVWVQQLRGHHSYVRDKSLRIYFDVIANTVGFTHLVSEDAHGIFNRFDMISRDGIYGWEDILTPGFTSPDIFEALQVEEQKQSADDPRNFLHHVKKRMDLGWWDNALYQAAWNARHPPDG